MVFYLFRPGRLKCKSNTSHGDRKAFEVVISTHPIGTLGSVRNFFEIDK
jgi:hypothetical protein